LEDLGANLEKVRTEIERLLHDSSAETEAEPAPKKPSKTPLLDQFGRDLTELARRNQLDPVIGRETEIERVIQILSRRTKNDAALERRFQPVYVDQPSLTETIDILNGVKALYEKHHRVVITDAAVQSAAVLSDRYVSDRALPDKAIDLIDEASARVRMKLTTTPDDLKELQKEIRRQRAEQDDSVNKQDFEAAAGVRDKVKKLQDKLALKEAAWRDK